jgi:hypothetical protein
LFEPKVSSAGVGASDGPVGSERPQAVERAARVKQATAIQLEERRDMGIPLKWQFSVRGRRQFEHRGDPV